MNTLRVTIHLFTFHHFYLVNLENLMKITVRTKKNLQKFVSSASSAFRNKDAARRVPTDVRNDAKRIKKNLRKSVSSVSSVCHFYSTSKEKLT